MQMYQLQIPTANSGRTAREAVTYALEDETDLLMEGVREGVPVELTASVSRLTRYREGGEFLVRFSGIIKPDAYPYFGDFSESVDDSPLIKVTVRSPS